MRSNDRIYIIDDDKERCDKLRTIFDFIGQFSEVTQYGNWQLSVNPNPSVIVLGACASFEKMMDELDTLVKRFPKTPILVIDAVLSTSECADRNIVDCLSFPFSYAKMLKSLHRCQIAKEAVKFITAGTHKTPLFRSLVGNSEGIRQVRKLIEQVADTEASVLILGESGTGKEVVARNIHSLSSRANKPFVPIN